MSLAVLSKLTGINKGHLSKVENSKAGLSDKNIAKIAVALDVIPEDITHKETP